MALVARVTGLRVALVLQAVVFGLAFAGGFLAAGLALLGLRLGSFTRRLRGGVGGLLAVLGRSSRLLTFDRVEHVLESILQAR